MSSTDAAIAVFEQSVSYENADNLTAAFHRSEVP